MVKKIIKMPDIGEGVAEAEIVEWHVKAGDVIAEDQLLAAVMTDKATVEVPSPVAGTVLQIGAEAGTVMAVGAMLVEIEVEGTGTDDAPPPPPVQAVPPVPVKPAMPEKPVFSAVQPSSTIAHDKPLASPAVRALARELGVDLTQVQGSGPAGRITRDDLDHFTASGGSAQSSAYQRRDGTEQIKITGLRRKIAERMAKSSREVAHFSYVEEVDVTDLEILRSTLNASHAERRGKLTVLPFILRALVVALQDFPQMNALYDEEAQVLTRHQAAHIGMATQTPSGLMVPVLHHAEAMDLWAMAAEITRLAAAAREGVAKREELSGSTITVTSLGDLGGLVTTPVINQPEVAIIGVNRIAIRPQWQDNQFVPRKMMNLSSSFDHRMVDGYEAAAFIRRIRQLLEVPATLFIEV
ncbi:2-oxo acid dehydrogenase subunit E2 [Pseudochrobactrum sp. Wa41.01b-1]|uniref:dihydrolipoamide acetyltransferase family protein n=1 Tax=Pseudochrobactrum sp. Wa41.01b-1 TaxID=2864102 RepID=UPI001C687F10|nr:dihydrolipoamide acetyltransferase family protein [Pseudochrobactrum sp. Wa41.01b-1]QYM72281.1 2-oxo acid dehydrogenase subunit E2 [Pseudochrobactrum sp. Wa41.01b-1]